MYLELFIFSTKKVSQNWDHTIQIFSCFALHCEFPADISPGVQGDGQNHTNTKPTHSLLYRALKIKSFQKYQKTPPHFVEFNTLFDAKLCSHCAELAFSRIQRRQNCKTVFAFQFIVLTRKNEGVNLISDFQSG